MELLVKGSMPFLYNLYLFRMHILISAQKVLRLAGEKVEGHSILNSLALPLPPLKLKPMVGLPSSQFNSNYSDKMIKIFPPPPSKNF